MLVLIITTSGAMAAVSVSQAASGGANISADKAGNASTPGFTTLGDLIITENAAGDFATGTAVNFVINLPAGAWVFYTGAGAPAMTVTSSGFLPLTNLSASASGSVLTITYTASAGSTFVANALTIHNIAVQAVNGNTIPNTATLTTAAGTGTINGIAGLNGGSLSQANGAPILSITSINDPEVVGIPFSATITGADQFGHASSGSISLTTNAGTISPATVTMTAGTTGSQTFTVTQAGTLKNITVTLSGVSKTSNTFTVNTGAFNKFSVANSGPQVSGITFNVVIIAQDFGGNPITGYNGTPALTVSNGLSISPAVTNVAFSNGVATQPITLIGNGSAVKVTATDGSASGTSNSFVVIANWYSGTAPNLDLTLASSWNANPDGTSGTAMPNTSMFTNGDGIFNIRNSPTPTIGSNWTVSGLSSNVILGDGANACNFTIGAARVLIAPIDLSNLGTLTLLTTGSLAGINYGIINAGSTVDYAMPATATIAGEPWGNLAIENTGLKTISSIQTIAGSLAVNSGATLTINSTSNRLLTVAKSVNVDGSFTL